MREKLDVQIVAGTHHKISINGVDITNHVLDYEIRSSFHEDTKLHITLGNISLNDVPSSQLIDETIQKLEALKRSLGQEGCHSGTEGLAEVS